MNSMFNFKGIFQASIKAIVIGILIVLLFILFILAGHLMGQTEEAHILSIVAEAVSILMIPAFFFLYLWTGFNGKRRYNLRARESGIATSLAYGIVALLNLALVSLLSILGVKAIIGYQFSPTMFELNGLFEEVALLGTTLCGAGMIFVGLIVNFVIGMCGSILAERRR